MCVSYREGAYIGDNDTNNNPPTGKPKGGNRGVIQQVTPLTCKEKDTAMLDERRDWTNEDWRDHRRAEAWRKSKMTVVGTIQAMQGAPYATTSFGFDELWAMSLKKLRELQDKLVKQYKETTKEI